MLPRETPQLAKGLGGLIKVGREMMKPKVYVTRKIAPEALDMISEIAEMRLWTGELAIPCETLLEQVKKVLTNCLIKC